MIYETLENHFSPKLSVIVERFKFHNRSRLEGEKVAEFVAGLRRLSEHCQFGATLEDMLRDRLVCGISDDRIQRRLLAKREFSFEKVVEIATATEMALKNLIDLGGKCTTMTTRSTKWTTKLNLRICSQNDSAIAAVETTIPRAVNLRMTCAKNVRRKATWLKYAVERRNHDKHKTNPGADRKENKERKEHILWKKAPIKTTSMLCIICPATGRNRSKWISNFVEGKS